MLKVAIVSNSEKDKDLAFTGMLKTLLTGLNAEAAVVCDLGNGGERYDSEDYASRCDMFFCVGGDGTFLRAARKYFIFGKPFLGINLGTLGFLAEIDKDSIEANFKKILGGSYTTQDRFMLKTIVRRKERDIFEDVAVNDVVISRTTSSRIMPVRTCVNDTPVDSYRGDGVIIATPTGSTGYSLSAGGPIVDPDVDLMIVTPICPHTLLSRPFITTGERVLRVEIDATYASAAAMTIDGQNTAEIFGGDSVVISRNDVKLKILKVTDMNFFDVLRKKIHGGGLN